MTNENVSRYKKLTAQERQEKRDAGFEALFLGEVERRAGADRKTMKDLLHSMTFSKGERENQYAEWLDRILGEKP